MEQLQPEELWGSEESHLLEVSELLEVSCLRHCSRSSNSKENSYLAEIEPIGDTVMLLPKLAMGCLEGDLVGLKSVFLYSISSIRVMFKFMLVL